MKFAGAGLAQVMTIDGEQNVMEDVMDLYANDIDLLSREAMTDFLSSTTSSSPSSSSGASPIPN